MTWNVQLDCALIVDHHVLTLLQHSLIVIYPCVSSPYYVCELKFCSCTFVDKFCVNKVIFFLFMKMF